LEEAISMIVIGVDVHKHSLTAVAVDELARALAEHTSAASGAGRLGVGTLARRRAAVGARGLSTRDACS